MSLIELTKKDVDRIEDVADLWDSKIIQMLANSLYYPLKGTKNPKIYAISTQNKDFEDILPENVLGMFEVTERDNRYALEFLEVDPMQAYENKERTFSKIGEACIDFIKSIFKNRDVEIQSIESAVPFYKKMGCVKPSGKCAAATYIIPKHK